MYYCYIFTSYRSNFADRWLLIKNASTLVEHRYTFVRGAVREKRCSSTKTKENITRCKRSCWELRLDPGDRSMEDQISCWYIIIQTYHMVNWYANPIKMLTAWQHDMPKSTVQKTNLMISSKDKLKLKSILTSKLKSVGLITCRVSELQSAIQDTSDTAARPDDVPYSIVRRMPGL